jgi:small-conductance mechanosensitive channel
VYKEMKLLRASVRSSQKIEKSFEKIFNVVFYFAISCIILNVLGYDPIAVFLSLSSVVLAFSFMISQASSKYVEGLLFILYRRPYDIGVSSRIISRHEGKRKEFSLVSTLVLI